MPRSNKLCGKYSIDANWRPLRFIVTVDTGSFRIKVAYCVKRVRFPYLGNDSDGR